MAKIKAKITEGIAPKDQVVLLEDMPWEDETSLGQGQVSALNMLEVAGYLFGGRVHGTLAYAWKVRSQFSRVANKEEKGG